MWSPLRNARIAGSTQLVSLAEISQGENNKKQNLWVGFWVKVEFSMQAGTRQETGSTLV
jgi:hypothetical protein